MIAATIATELDTSTTQIETALKLLAEGNTVPFIARYRKEATGGLDDTQLRYVETRAHYLEELASRKQAILETIAEQGKLTKELEAQILECESKARLEDLYLPFKKRRKTAADRAKEAGLEPLVQELLSSDGSPATVAELAERFTGVSGSSFDTVEKVLDGACAIVTEQLSLNADLVGELREHLYSHGQLRARVVKGKEQEGEKFKDYFDFSQSLEALPSHRILALFRGEKEGILRLNIDAGDAEQYVSIIARHSGLHTSSPWVNDVVHFAWKKKLAVSAAFDNKARLKERADHGALEVFARNLKDVLLAAPAGQRATLGLDPGYRNGVKCAVIDPTGKVLDTLIVYPHQPQNRWSQAVNELATACATHGVELMAIGNGTASRETEKLAKEVADLLVQAGGTRPTPVVVSEAGASVYSASELAAKEFPEMDVSLRGAVSIARRLQDPLAELVKIDPQSIGVGQYQHDVNQGALAKSLDSVVEDAVNAVGVDLNTASGPLLERVAGITSTLAHNIVEYRDEHGAFPNRKKLLKVPRLGPKAFEQCAGFLRIRGGDNPLDSSAVHPESYSVVTKIEKETGLAVAQLLGNTRVLSALNPAQFTDENTGIPTVRDIIAELNKPGRDPRPEFKTATFKAGIEKISDLKPGMILEGTVTNVAAFGAFVDVGVHQDGLVHVSAMSDHFVKDPHEVVRSGQIVKVKVMEVDPARKRIGLSLRLDSEPGAQGTKKQPARSAKKPQAKRTGATGTGTMAEAMKQAGFH